MRYVLLLMVLVAACAPAPGDPDEIKTVYDSLSPQAKALYYAQSEELTRPVPERLVELDEKTIGCFGPARIQDMDTAGENLGGQCCGALTDYEAYMLQLDALNAFLEEHDAPEYVPADPYDIPVAQAQRLTSWDDLVLTGEQQAVYDDALETSHHGPCCCKCWKWYMMSGLGKQLIQEGWTAEDVAELWDLSSSCGHSEDTNIQEHYEHH